MALPIVVVTGSAGFVGSEITKQLLDVGYHVRATVRSAGPKTDFLGKLAEGLPGKLELVEGCDLTVEGSFDKAMEGAIYLFHTASPADFGDGNPEHDQRTIVDPAVNGTRTVILAAAKSKTVKRIVLTSSVVALSEKTSVGSSIMDGSEYNTETTLATDPYSFSKVQAEKLAWSLVKEHGLDLVTILPAQVVGPAVSTRGGFSVDSVKALLEGASLDTIYWPTVIDNRDVAAAHIRAAELPSASGRYILSSATTYNKKEISDALKAAFPKAPIADAEESKVQKVYDTSKAEKELGMKLIPAAKSFVDEARTLIALDYVKPVPVN